MFTELEESPYNTLNWFCISYLTQPLMTEQVT